MFFYIIAGKWNSIASANILNISSNDVNENGDKFAYIFDANPTSGNMILVDKLLRLISSVSDFPRIWKSILTTTNVAFIVSKDSQS